jgi:hypothetical protein
MVNSRENCVCTEGGGESRIAGTYCVGNLEAGEMFILC